MTVLTAPDPIAKPTGNGLDADPHWCLVQRIIATPEFARSPRLVSFLLFVTERSLNGDNEEINEQSIGVGVFGRRSGFDSSDDNIVRSHASRLRHRLDLYFEQEGAKEPIRVAIPKGGYVPVFTARIVVGPNPSPAPQNPKSVVNETATDSVSRQDSFLISAPKWRAALPWSLCGLLTLALVAVIGHYKARATAESIEVTSHPLWGRIFTSGQPTLEVPGDSGLVLYHSLDRRDVSLLEYLGGAKDKTDSSLHQLTPEIADIEAIVTRRRYTSIVDLDVAVSLGQFAQKAHSSLEVRFPRDIRPNDFKQGNAVLVGASEANPWVELFEPNMNFVVENNMVDHTYVVRNKAPQSGEPTGWQFKPNDPQHRTYAIIALVPNLSGTGNVLIVEGISMAGTEAAWDFVSHDSELLPFLKKVRRPDGTLPSFELLLGTQNMSSSAVHGTVLAWRAHQ